MHKYLGPQNYKPIYKSEIKPAQMGRYMWNDVSLLTSDLCNEDPDREIKIEFFKSSKTGKHTNLGYISFNLAQLKEDQREFALHGRNAKPTQHKIKFETLNFHRRFTFLEYVFGGCEI